jgi:hypothetical protein
MRRVRIERFWQPSKSQAFQQLARILSQAAMPSSGLSTDKLCMNSALLPRCRFHAHKYSE